MTAPRESLLAALDAAERERSRAWHAVNEVARASYRTHRLRHQATVRAMHQAHSSEAAYYAALMAVEGYAEACQHRNRFISDPRLGFTCGRCWMAFYGEEFHPLTAEDVQALAVTAGER